MSTFGPRADAICRLKTVSSAAHSGKENQLFASAECARDARLSIRPTHEGGPNKCKNSLSKLAGKNGLILCDRAVGPRPNLGGKMRSRLASACDREETKTQQQQVHSFSISIFLCVSNSSDACLRLDLKERRVRAAERAKQQHSYI